MAPKGLNIWFSRAMLESAAFAAIKTATAHRILAIFFTKRQWAPTGRRGETDWTLTNNGQIIFTYAEAKKKYGISNGSFRDAIDELIDKGFIDIAQSGAGMYKSANLYSISDRWKLYGTDGYKEPEPRPKKPINKGFQKGNQYGQNCGKKTEATVMVQHSSTVTGQHS